MRTDADREIEKKGGTPTRPAWSCGPGGRFAAWASGVAVGFVVIEAAPKPPRRFVSRAERGRESHRSDTLPE